MAMRFTFEIDGILEEKTREELEAGKFKRLKIAEIGRDALARRYGLVN